MKIRTPNLPCIDNTWFFEYFYGFLGFVVREISGHFWGVYQSHYCATAVAFLFSFVYVIYLNIASYLYGKQIKSKLWTKLYLWMIFICVRLNRLHFHECRPMPLKPQTTKFIMSNYNLCTNVRMFLLPEKPVLAVISTMVMCESATHKWKNFLMNEVSKYSIIIMIVFYFEILVNQDVTSTPK